MRRFALSTRSVLLLAILVGTFGLAAPTRAHSSVTPIVCIDPGHGGRDPGANFTYNGVALQEKDLTLKIGLLLREKLQSAGFQVVMTRQSDLPAGTTMDNTPRAEICNGSNQNGTNPGGLVADTVISVHLNSTRSGTGTTNYFKPYYGKQLKDLALARKFTETFVLLQPNATSATDTIRAESPGQFASAVLLKSKGHAIIAETVFLSHQEEQKRFAVTDETRSQQIADALFVSTKAWYAEHSAAQQ